MHLEILFQKKNKLTDIKNIKIEFILSVCGDYTLPLDIFKTGIKLLITSSTIFLKLKKIIRDAH